MEFNHGIHRKKKEKVKQHGSLPAQGRQKRMDHGIHEKDGIH